MTWQVHPKDGCCKAEIVINEKTVFHQTGKSWLKYCTSEPMHKYRKVCYCFHKAERGQSTVTQSLQKNHLSISKKLLHRNNFLKHKPPRLNYISFRYVASYAYYTVFDRCKTGQTCISCSSQEFWGEPWVSHAQLSGPLERNVGTPECSCQPQSEI